MFKNNYEVKGNYVSIEVKNSKEKYQCLVGIEDFNKILEINKTLLAYESSKYKKPYVYLTVNKKKTKLHRLLTNCPADKIVDHINGNVLDNRQENLRICNSIINLQNTQAQKNSKSGVKGVSWGSTRKLWIGLVQINGVRKRVIETKDFKKCCKAVEEYRKNAYSNYLDTLKQ